MADEQLRSLERRWAASRLPEDEQALVLARVRAGTIDGATLALASALGSRSARRALGDRKEPTLPQDPAAWLAAVVERAGPASAQRGAAAALRQVLPLWDARPERCERHGAVACADPLCGLDPRPRAALEAVETSLLMAAPLSPARLKELDAARRACDSAADDAVRGRGSQVRYRGEDTLLRATYDEGSVIVHVALAVSWLVTSLLARDGDEALHARLDAEVRPGRELPGGVFVSTLWGTMPRHVPRGQPLPWSSTVVPLAVQAVTEALVSVRAHARSDAARRGVDGPFTLSEALHAMRKAMGAELAPWLLGLGDPLADRVRGA